MASRRSREAVRGTADADYPRLVRGANGEGLGRLAARKANQRVDRADMNGE